MNVMDFLDLRILHLVCFAGFAGLIFAFRRRLFGELNLVGMFIIAWFFLEYVGMVVTSLSPEIVFDYWELLDLTFFTEEKNRSMVIYNNLGLLCFLGGALLIPSPKTSLIFVPPQVHLSEMKIERGIILFICFLFFGFYLIFSDVGFNIPLLTLFTSGFTEAYEQRLSKTSSPIQAYITWNVIPYLGFYVFAFCWFQRKRHPSFLLLGFIPLLLSSVSMLASLHKREFITWLACFGFFWLLSRKQNPRLRSLPLMKLSAYAGAIYFILVGCFMLFSSHTSLEEGFFWALEVSFMELAFRGVLSSLPYFSLVPDLVPYHEFQNIGLFRRLLGAEVTYSDTAILFSYLYPHLPFARGSISSNMLTDFYAAYGPVSLVLGCFLGGLGLGVLNYFFLSLPSTLPNLVLKSFLLIFPINICIATYFQSAFGYGLFFHVLCWWLLSIEPFGKQRKNERLMVSYPQLAS